MIINMQSMAVISTAHVSLKTIAWLEDNEGRCIVHLPDGFLMPCAPNLPLKVFYPPRTPSDLNQVLEAAKSAGAEWLLLLDNAEEVDGLPTYGIGDE